MLCWFAEQKGNKFGYLKHILLFCISSPYYIACEFTSFVIFHCLLFILVPGLVFFFGFFRIFLFSVVTSWVEVLFWMPACQIC
uniref:Uncharacterized protein n=1 Tax=Arundo donax TaxID=35708 RepID=A0A0A9G243_ARUDO